ncbi:MAG: hypothetical protein KC550_04175, partial [Nanoarchaeota archaeon]|nr:hypothetical protein [Nanoarchaeota archaeon]
AIQEGGLAYNNEIPFDVWSDARNNAIDKKNFLQKFMNAYEDTSDLFVSCEYRASPSTTFVQIPKLVQIGRLSVQNLFYQLDLNPRHFLSIFECDKTEQNNLIHKVQRFNGRYTFDAKENLEKLLNKNIEFHRGYLLEVMERWKKSSPHKNVALIDVWAKKNRRVKENRLKIQNYMEVYKKTQKIKLFYGILASPESTFVQIVAFPELGNISIETLFEELNLNPREFQKIFKYGKMKDLVPNQGMNKYGNDMIFNGELVSNAKENLERILEGKIVDISIPPPLFEKSKA